ncbi:poly-gamma-glutamate biosynthesis protein PgsC [Acidobacteriota bacterium]
MIYETFIIGIVLALLFTELTDTYPGGLIVPAYMALYLDQPLRILVSVGVAFFALFIFKFLSRYLILFGKRRFVLLILVGALISHMWGLLWPQVFDVSTGFRVVGWIIPGLLANNLERQRYWPTLAGLVTVSITTYFVVRILQFFLPG